jgi:hypothetical protein
VYIKINSKCIEDLNVKPQTAKFLEEKRGKLLEMGLSRGFFDVTQKT